MTFQKSLLTLALVGTLLIGSLSPVAAHETQTVEGYDVTFGGADEPLITGERMWLEVEIVDNETGEPVAEQADSLELYVQNAGNDRGEVDLGEKHGEEGVYEAPVIFTEPGTYTVHLEGSIEDTEVHTHFETEVQDRTDLEYPGSASESTDGDSPTEDHRADEAGFGTVGIVLGAIGAAAALGAFLARRR